MSTLLVALRAASLLVFAAFVFLPRVGGSRPRPKAGAARERGGRAPVAANIAAFVLFFAALTIFRGGADGPWALPLAISGFFLALAGVALVFRARAELGPAWSFVPEAERGAGPVTTGPYRCVRHPIYLGLVLLALGQSLAFASWPAAAVALIAIVPTFAWRARAEEKLLGRIFGARYAAYRQRTRMIIPRVL
jgi:protein-S-isoprenylcysteine O-methyltransferase Ste14